MTLAPPIIARQASEETLRQVGAIADLVDLLRAPALAVDGAGRILRANQAARAALGEAATAAGALAQGFSDLEQIRIATRAGERPHGEGLHLYSGDQQRIFRCSPLAGEPGGAILYGLEDVSAQRAHLLRMQQKMDRFLELIGTVSDFFHETDASLDTLRLFVPVRHNGVIKVSEQVIRFPEDCIDMSYDPAGIADWIADLHQRKPYRDRVHRAPSADGREIYYRASGAPFYDTEGEFKGFRGVSINVTAQVLAERALKESEGKLRQNRKHLAQAQRIAAIGSTERDLVNDTFEWSDEMYRLLGVERLQAMPSDADLLDFIHPADRERAVETVAIIRSGQRPRPQEFRFVQPTGETRILYVETEIIRDELGHPIRTLSIFKDVTEIRTRIGELEQARSELERQRAQLQKAAVALARARDEAETASRSKSTFLAQMSHELRTPLNAVIGFSQVMRGEMFGALQPKYLEYAKDIHDSGQHLLNLINQILDLSKIEAGKSELNPSLVDPVALIDACERLVRERAEAKGIAIALELAQPMPWLTVDEIKIKQILLNLLSNAIKFTKAGGRVELRAGIADERFVFEVRDDGIGMRPEDVPVALLPFHQVGDQANRAEPGTGLGLPLAKAFAEMHGGELALSSELGVGTLARVSLPLRLIHRGDAAAPRRSVG